MIVLFALWVLDGAKLTPRDAALFVMVSCAYLAFALFILFCALRLWWLDFRLALVSPAVDALAFWMSLVFTQEIGFDTFSPFITFFAFLVISAAARWNQKYMPAAAIALGVTFGLAGLLLYDIGDPVNLEKLPRRFSYLLILAILLGWFATMRGTSGRALFGNQNAGTSPSRFTQALAFAMETSGANGAAIVWTAEDEPMSKLRVAGELGAGSAELPPGTIDDTERLSPMLFDRINLKQLILEADNKVAGRKGSFPAGLADYLEVPQGLSVPLSGNLGSGQLVLTGIASMCWDDIGLGIAVAREVSAALDDEVAGELSRALAETRIRTDVARDLHDSLAQSLAGARFRLEALCDGFGKDNDIKRELENVIASLRAEQDHVRAVINRLRKGNAEVGQRNLDLELERLAKALADQWRVSVSVVSDRSLPSVPATLVYGMQQLAREAVANAVRHGKAANIIIRLHASDPNKLSFVIEDDGEGIQGGRDAAMPRSILERAMGLGGIVQLETSANGTIIELQVPVRAIA